MTPPIQTVKGALRQRLLSFQSEAELQAMVSRTLEALGMPYSPEFRLTPSDRIDFLCGGLGIEVKVDGTLAQLTRQLARYAAHPSVEALLVVTNRSRLTALPDSLGGKPIDVVYTVGAAL